MAKEYAFKHEILGNDEQLKRNMSEVIVSTIETIRTENLASLVIMTATDTDKTELVAVNSQPSFILLTQLLHQVTICMDQEGAALLSHDLALPLLREEVNRLSTLLNCLQVSVDEA
ncbi:hypothetical protein [Streptococcus hyointestinalis]|uniref:hypothetical protein n=1 Tax=Streptococcus hyointestinalis TaxID=1337 RepID=UPI0013E060CD|nr:hypothetical protein [Streptococcus hyointestinalis]